MSSNVAASLPPKPVLTPPSQEAVLLNLRCVRLRCRSAQHANCKTGLGITHPRCLPALSSAGGLSPAFGLEMPRSLLSNFNTFHKHFIVDGLY